MNEVLRVTVRGREFYARPEVREELSAFLEAFGGEAELAYVSGHVRIVEMEDLPAEVVDGQV